MKSLEKVFDEKCGGLLHTIDGFVSLKLCSKNTYDKLSSKSKIYGHKIIHQTFVRIPIIT